MMKSGSWVQQMHTARMEDAREQGLLRDKAHSGLADEALQTQPRGGDDEVERQWCQ